MPKAHLEDEVEALLWDPAVENRPAAHLPGCEERKAGDGIGHTGLEGGSKQT